MAVIAVRDRAFRGAARAWLLAVGVALAGCAAEEPPPEDLPLPPEPPARVQAARQPATGASRPRAGEAEAPPTPPASAEPAPPADAAPPPAAPPATPPAWRVARDGTLGCADATPLRLLRQGADTPPRLLAEARAAGACRTTFRLNAWALETVEGDLVRLRLVNGDALTLWFLRVDVVPP